MAAGSLPVRWVTCDEGYGSDTVFLDRLAALGLGYCAEVPHSTRVWPTRPEMCVPPSPVTGRPPTRLRLAPGAPRAQAVQEVAAQVPACAWRHLQLQKGSQGPLCADFAALRVVAARRAQPGPDVRGRCPAGPARSRCLAAAAPLRAPPSSKPI